MAKPAATLAQETEVPEHLEPASPLVAVPGERVTMTIESLPGEVALHLGALAENINLSPVDARQLSKALLKAALASEAKAVDRAAKIVGPDMALDILKRRADMKLEEAAALAEESEEPS